VNENPEDEPRNEQAEPSAPADPEPLGPEPAANEPAADAEPEPEPGPTAEAPAEPEPEPEPERESAPTAEEPEPEPEPAPSAEAHAEPEPGPALTAEVPAEPEPEPEPEPAPTAEAPAEPEPEPEPAPETPVPTGSAPQAGTESPAEAAREEAELAPRQKPEIPGADLEPDIVPDAGQFLDAEAQAAAEAEAEAAAARAEQESEDEQTQPIADAAIDLAAGARYTATGKRKTAVARVILRPGTGTYSINNKPLETFFPRETLQRMIRQPLEAVGYEARMDVVARMHGGGVSAQAGALRHGVSRALIEADPNLRGELKRRGFLTRDPRVKERKKAGLKKARKRPQFSKR
jgi:small subunit ribosomal protein S9